MTSQHSPAPTDGPGFTAEAVHAAEKPPRPPQIRAAAVFLGVVAVLWAVVILLAAHDLTTYDDYVREASRGVHADDWEIDDAILSSVAGNVFVMVVAGVGIVIAAVAAFVAQLRSRAGLVLGAVGAGLQALACGAGSCAGWLSSAEDTTYYSDLQLESQRLERLNDPGWIRPAWATTAFLLMALAVIALVLLLSREARDFSRPAEALRAPYPAPIAYAGHPPHGVVPGYPAAPGYLPVPGYGQTAPPQWPGPSAAIPSAAPASGDSAPGDFAPGDFAPGAGGSWLPPI